MKNGKGCSKGTGQIKSTGQSNSTGQSKVSLCTVKTRAERNTEYTKERECYIRLHQHINRMHHGKIIKKVKKKKLTPGPFQGQSDTTQ